MPAAKKSTANKVSAKSTKTAAKETAVEKTASKKSSAKTTRKYSPQASQDVAEELHEMKRGELHIGRSDKLVTNPKQAIAIGLAKARREGAKVPPNPNTGH